MSSQRTTVNTTATVNTIPLKSEFDEFTQCMKQINLAANYGYNRVICNKLHPIYTTFLLKQGNQIQKKNYGLEITFPTSLYKSKR